MIYRTRVPLTFFRPDRSTTTVPAGTTIDPVDPSDIESGADRTAFYRMLRSDPHRLIFVHDGAYRSASIGPELEAVVPPGAIAGYWRASR